MQQSFHDAVLASMLCGMVLCLAVGVRHRKAISGSAGLLVGQAGVAFAMDVLGRYTAEIHMNNHAFYNVYSIIEFFLVILAARDYFPGYFLPFVLIGSLLFGAAFVYDMLNTGFHYGAFHAFTAGWLVLGLTYLIVLLANLNGIPGRKPRGLVIIGGVLVAYYFCTIPRFGLFRYLIESFASGMSNMVVQTGNVLGSLRYVLTAVGLWLMVRDGFFNSKGTPAPDRGTLGAA